MKTSLIISHKINIDKKLLLLEAIGLLFCWIGSFIFHFAFDWLGKPQALAWLFATTESVWEHSKIIFFPFAIYSFIEYFILKPNMQTFLTAKSIPLMLCIPAMLTSFYTYSGIIGRNITAIDIIIALAIILAMNIASYKILVKRYVAKYVYTYATIVAIITICLIIFTYLPPHINLFYDTLKQRYGF